MSLVLFAPPGFGGFASNSGSLFFGELHAGGKRFFGVAASGGGFLRARHAPKGNGGGVFLGHR